MKLQFSVLTFCAFLTFNLPTTLASTSTLEEQGKKQFEAHQYDEAQKSFFKALGLNPSSYTSIEYLTRMSEERGDIPLAELDYKRATAKGAKKVLGKKTSDDGLFQTLTGNGSFESYIFSMLGQAAFPAAQNYFLGYLFQKQGLTGQAEYYFGQAESLSRTLAAQNTPKNKVDVARPLDYFYLEPYDQPVFSKYSLYQIHPKQFGERELYFDKRVLRINVGTGLGIDTNAIELSESAEAARAFPQKSGTFKDLSLRFRAQTSPTRPFTFGADIQSAFYQYTRDDLGAFDRLKTVPELWVSWWNEQGFEIRAQYDYRHEMKDRNNFKLDRQTHGPQLGVSAYISPKYQIDFAYGLRRSFFPADSPLGQDQKSGTEHRTTLRGSALTQYRAIRPFLQYSFSHHGTDGQNFFSNIHTLEVGTSLALTTGGRVALTTGYGFGIYPLSTAQRRDQSRQVRFSMGQPIFDPNFLIVFDARFLDNTSTQPFEFSYRRFDAVLGLNYGLGI